MVAASPRSPGPSDPPGRFTDGEGREIVLERQGSDPGALEACYEHFEDDSRAQGIPPRSAPRRTAWIEELLEGYGVVAWHEDAIVGHAVLIPYDDAAELAVFVRPDYQSAGIGTALVRSLLDLGRSVGIERVTLVVERANVVAVRLYRATGFEVTDRHNGEYEMARPL